MSDIQRRNYIVLGWHGVDGDTKTFCAQIGPSSAAHRRSLADRVVDENGFTGPARLMATVGPTPPPAILLRSLTAGSVSGGGPGSASVVSDHTGSSAQRTRPRDNGLGLLEQALSGRLGDRSHCCGSATHDVIVVEVSMLGEIRRDELACPPLRHLKILVALCGGHAPVEQVDCRRVD